MDWVIGPDISGGTLAFDVLSATGQLEKRPIDTLTKDVPLPSCQRKRLLHIGDFSTWKTSFDATEYLRAFGQQLPKHIENRQAIFISSTPNGFTIHVPVSVMLRALFKPARILHPAIFSPAGIDQLGFVDYASTPAQVVLDTFETKLRDPGYAESQRQAIRWLHSSFSARKSAQSVYQNALQGLLNLPLPAGQVRMALHGSKRGNDLYVTKVSLVLVKVLPTDSITGREKTFFFNTTVNEDRVVLASTCSISVPLHPDGQSSLTDTEWRAVEPVLQGKRSGHSPLKHSRRALLNAILYKISSGTPWRKVARDNFSVISLTATFRRWLTDGRLTKALAVLNASRRAAS